MDAIRDSKVPCIETAVTDMAKMMNNRAVEECTNMYRELMDKDVQFPTKTAKVIISKLIHS